MVTRRIESVARIGAAIVFAGAALEELARVVLRAPWPGTTLAVTTFVAILLASVWALGAVGTSLGGRASWLFDAGWVASRLGLIGMLAHGLFTTWAAETVGGPRLGLLFVTAAIGQLILLKAAFGGVLFPPTLPRARLSS